MCYPSHHVAIMSIVVLWYCMVLYILYQSTNSYTIAVFCENINAIRVGKEAVK
jgi:hypothetical protein